MNEPQPVSIDDIMAAFRIFDGTYQRDMVDAALQRREEIVPRLIAILEEIIADPEGFLEQEDRFDHIYALMLLGHFKAAAAHAAIVQVFSLEPKIVDDLFGDHITESLAGVLMRTCGDDLRQMRIMALDRSIDPYCRSAAVQAMGFAVAAGIAAREEVTAFIAELFGQASEEADTTFLSLAAVTLLHLYPDEHMALIRKAFEEEIIDHSVVSLGSFERVLAEGREAALARSNDTWRRRYDWQDIHAAMSGWACFSESDDLAAAAGPQDLIDSGLYGRPQPKVAKKNDQARQKSRRKQAKVSKRKNRK
ncbi:MAG: DUF1186 domain-containing protein [Desulfobacterales bacterium]|nr:DUF1186 domain-containing protein [Desulfobacterales bacterium]